ncbi:MAG TPA: M14 family zinc carboxypeptidase, partial [Candidatus Cloacimonadota bacterium]|nr:M14 family zinc carboxypeptidase [Candidatus Cloacimonadota bacterium]
MNKLLMLIAFCLLAGALAAFPAHIQSWDITHDVEVINKLQISIDQVNHRTGAITVYLRDDNEFQLLQANGYDPVRMPDDARDYYLELLESTRNSDNPLNQYYSIDEYHSFMQNVANTYPSICQLVQYGTSVQGRPLYAMKISDFVQVNEAEPEVKLIGS